MDVREFVKGHFGGNISAFAREFKVTPGAVHYWFKHGVTPQREAQFKLWALQIPRATQE